MPTNQKQNPYLPYIQNLLHAADLDLLPEEEKDDYIADVTAEIEKRVGLLLMQELSEDDFQKYTDLVTSVEVKDLEQVQRFLEGKIENWTGKFQNLLKQFADDFIATAKSIKLK